MSSSFSNLIGGTSAFNGEIKSWPEDAAKVKIDGYTKKGFIQHVALMCYSYADFDKEDAYVLATKAKSYASVLAEMLEFDE